MPPVQVIDIIQAYCNPITGFTRLDYCLQGIYNLGVALSVVVAFILFLIGAFKNLLSTIPDVKLEGKKQMRNAVIGLMVIFGFGTILYWVNPAIFNAKILIFKVTNIETPLLWIKGDIVRIPSNDPLISITGQRNAVVNTELGSLRDLPIPEEVKKAIELAHEYAKNSTGQNEYLNKYRYELEGSRKITSCSHFVWLVLRESGAVPKVCYYQQANNFPYLFQQVNVEFERKSKGLKWIQLPFNINSIRAGDVLVKQRGGGRMGHVAIVILVKDRGGKDQLALAHASWRKYPPRITNVYRNFDFIYRLLPATSSNS